MKKQFIDPKMTKCEQPLDKVTMSVGGYCNNNDRPFNGNNGGPNGKPTHR